MSKHDGDRNREPFSISDAARRLGLTPAQVRRWAENYRDFLGLRRGDDGQWMFSAAQLRLLGALAARGSLLQTTETPSGARPPEGASSSFRPHVGDPVPTARPGADADPTAGGFANSPAEGELLARLDDVALYLQDLAEETKQVQILLSRVIALLEADGRTAPAHARPWEPEELVPAPDAVHAFIPTSPPAASPSPAD